MLLWLVCTILKNTNQQKLDCSWNSIKKSKTKWTVLLLNIFLFMNIFLLVWFFRTYKQNHVPDTSVYVRISDGRTYKFVSFSELGAVVNSPWNLPKRTFKQFGIVSNTDVLSFWIHFNSKIWICIQNNARCD